MHRRLIVAEGIRWDARMQRMRSDAERLGVPMDTAPRLLLDDTIGGGRHQGVLLLTSRYPYADLDALLESARPVLVLDHLQDPQNVGSLLRTAEAFGVPNVILPKDRSAEITPSVVNASAGAVEQLRVAQETNISRALQSLKKRGYWIVGLDNAPDAVSLEAIDVPIPFGLVVGAEGSGLSQAATSHCDYVARIDQAGTIESLNAAVAGSIALFWLTHDIRNPGDVAAETA